MAAGPGADHQRKPAARPLADDRRPGPQRVADHDRRPRLVGHAGLRGLRHQRAAQRDGGCLVPDLRGRDRRRDLSHYGNGPAGTGRPADLKLADPQRASADELVTAGRVLGGLNFGGDPAMTLPDLWFIIAVAALIVLFWGALIFG